MPDFAVFTDLDGTLLDHHDYSFTAALPALGLLRERGIPVVLNSSKTAAELAQLRRELALDTPIIAENGAAIVAPDGSLVHEFGAARTGVLDVLGQLRAESGYRWRGFADMSVADIVETTGLKPADAELAAQKRWSEPLQWQDSARRLEEFAAALREHGLVCTKGGRFVHVSSDVDKGRAMCWLATTLWPAARLIALGDSDNDRAMLEAAEQPVVVRSPVHAPLQLDNPATLVTEGYGPAGWNEAILQLLDTP